jgi:hypothetical protein
MPSGAQVLSPSCGGCSTLRAAASRARGRSEQQHQADHQPHYRRDEDPRLLEQVAGKRSARQRAPAAGPRIRCPRNRANERTKATGDPTTATPRNAAPGSPSAEPPTR